MPHKCVRCGRVYENKSAELLKGCSCGSRVFVFLREKPAEEGEGLAQDEKVATKALEDLGWLEEELAFLSKEKPVSIDIEAVENLRILEHGSYELDVSSLMKGEPLVIKSDKGIYYIKLPGYKKKGKK